MIGAAIGDIVGSRFEMINYSGNKTFENYTKFPLFDDACKPTDDTVLSCAVADCLMNKKPFAETYKEYAKKYPLSGFGSGFIQWVDSESLEPYNSFGNGAAMRISPVGWFYDSLEEVLNGGEESAKPTHNHPEGIKGAQSIAACIFMARTGKNKATIKNYIEGKFNYDLSRTLDEIRPTYEFTSEASKSVPEAIIAFLESQDYEDCIRRAISIGGDSDTIACMAGGIAEAFYGGLKAIPQDLLHSVNQLLQDKYPDLYKIITNFDLLIYSNEAAFSK